MNNCECADKDMSGFVTERVGYAYVPYQKLNRVYTPERAITQGTIFPELDLGIGDYERGIYDGK